MSHWKQNKIKSLLLLCVIFIFQFSFSQDLTGGDGEKGKQLFKDNCTACHKTDQKAIGPALKGVYTKNTAKEIGKDLEWFKKWIANSSEVIASGDPYANKLFNEYNKTQMTAFPALQEADVVNILTYLEDPTKFPDKPKEVAQPVAAPASNNLNSAIWIGFAIISLLLVGILFRLNSLLALTQAPELAPTEEEKIHNFSDLYRIYKPVIMGLVGVFALLAFWSLWAWLFGIGVDRGYRPDQPIYFSHKIHAGNNKINCQVCHSGAKYGKVSEIPSLNVCMNCHKNITEYKGAYIEPGKDKAFYDAEIDKLFDHAGFDKSTSTYTGKEKVLKWTRIHNMPDFVAFNHSQHVVVGEKAILKGYNERNPKKPIDVVCKACHGAIDTMNVVEMANDFTMEFCMDCHRKTEIDMGNGYNSHYFKQLHEKVKKLNKKDPRLTVDAIGGIECGKCHY